MGKIGNSGFLRSHSLSWTTVPALFLTGSWPAGRRFEAFCFTADQRDYMNRL